MIQRGQNMCFGSTGKPGYKIIITLKNCSHQPCHSFPLSNIHLIHFWKEKSSSEQALTENAGLAWGKPARNAVHVSWCPAMCSVMLAVQVGWRVLVGWEDISCWGQGVGGIYWVKWELRAVQWGTNFKFKKEIFFLKKKGWTEMKILHIPCSGVGFCGLRECMAKATDVWRLFRGKSQPGLWNQCSGMMANNLSKLEF